VSSSKTCKYQNDEAIIRAADAPAEGFDLQVIAEGVENEMQKDFLIEVECHEVQGYLFNRPLPERAFARIIIGIVSKSSKIACISR
jgi:EAL domain-containing protein (putative c-di-GMP-specific phosphodiesterase class I)